VLESRGECGLGKRGGVRMIAAARRLVNGAQRRLIGFWIACHVLLVEREAV
jgi:hypothetical protein